MKAKRLVASCLAGLLGHATSACAGSFEAYHPDQYYRALGEEAWRAQRFPEAYARFLSAARYGDKSSQLAIATMHWRGEGVAEDAATAYAWADLASERGYPDFVVLREAYWAAMGEDEQGRALELGAKLYAEYGDDVAKPRLQSLLRRGLAQKTGTRTGSRVHELGVIELDSATRAYVLAGASGSGGSMSLATLGSGARVAHSKDGGYYGDEHWHPVHYWIAQDAVWLPKGEVNVGPLETGRAPPEGSRDR